MEHVNNAIRLVRDLLDDREFGVECEGYIQQAMKHLPQPKSKDDEEYYQLQTLLVNEFTTAVLLRVLRD